MTADAASLAPPRGITLHVVGVPAPQGSKTRMPNGAMVDGSSKTGRAALSAWREAVAAKARDWLADHPQPPLAEAVHVVLHFSFAPVASDRFRFWHTTKPDIDKIVRSTFDALVAGGLLKDDAFVCRLVVDKAYCGPDEPAGCEVSVFPMGADEAAKRADRKRRAADARKSARVAKVDWPERAVEGVGV